MIVGENPAVGSANGKANRLGLANLNWLVVRDLVEIETASFWYDSEEIESGELKTEEIATEVFFLPAAAHVEKDGSFTNTQRLLQWHFKARRAEGRLPQRALVLLPPRPNDPREAEGLAGSEATGRPRPDVALPDARRRSRSRAPRPCSRRSAAGTRDGSGARRLQAAEGRRLDRRAAAGSTAASTRTATTRPRGGSRTGSRTTPRSNGRGRGRRTGRMLYNRASADPDGRAVVRAQALRVVGRGEQKWTGHDTPDFDEEKPPDYVPPDGASARTRSRGDHPFIMQADGQGWLYVPQGLEDGPLPTHYEPHESPFGNPLYAQRANPRRQQFRRPPRIRTTRPTASRGRALSVRRDDVPADRAPHAPAASRGSRPVPRRAAAGDVRRGAPGARARARARARRLGDDRHGALARSRRGSGHRPHQAGARRRARPSPGRAAVPLGHRAA